MATPAPDNHHTRTSSRASHRHHHQGPLLNQPLTQHGLPRTPISPTSGLTLLSHPRQPHPPRASTPESLNLSLASLPLGSSKVGHDDNTTPPMTPFSPSAFPGEAFGGEGVGVVALSQPLSQLQMQSLPQQACQHCACCAQHQQQQQQQQQRSRAASLAPSISASVSASARSSTLALHDDEAALRRALEREALRMVRRSEEEASGVAASQQQQQQQRMTPPGSAGSTASASGASGSSAGSGSGFKRFGERIKSVFGNGNGNGNEGGMGQGKKEKEKEKGLKRGMSQRRKSGKSARDKGEEEEVVEVGGAHWTEM